MKEIKLGILDNFVCLGADCPATCCTTWELAVSESDLARWQVLEDATARKRMLGAVLERNPNGKRLFELRKYADGHCVHFNDKGLCQIQLDYGHNILPEVCQSYPRFQQQHGEITLSSARLACPGVVALLAKNEPGCEFSTEFPELPQSPQDGDTQVVDISILTEELSVLLERVLATTNVPLGVRIYFVAQLLGDIANHAMGETLDRRVLTKLCGRSEDAVARRLNDALKAYNKGKIAVNKDRLGRFWQMAFQHCGVYRDSGLLEKIHHVPMVNELQHPDAENTQAKNYFVRLYNRIEKLRNDAYKKFSPQILSLMDSYLRVTLMNNGFPWQPVRDNFNATFLNCILPFAKVQMLLWILATQQDRITIDDAVNAIAAVERIMTSTDSTLDLLAAQPDYLRLDQYSACFLEIV